MTASALPQPTMTTSLKAFIQSAPSTSAKDDSAGASPASVDNDAGYEAFFQQLQLQHQQLQQQQLQQQELLSAVATKPVIPSTSPFPIPPPSDLWANSVNNLNAGANIVNNVLPDHLVNATVNHNNNNNAANNNNNSLAVNNNNNNNGSNDANNVSTLLTGLLSSLKSLSPEQIFGLQELLQANPSAGFPIQHPQLPQHSLHGFLPQQQQQLPLQLTSQQQQRQQQLHHQQLGAMNIPTAVPPPPPFMLPDGTILDPSTDPLPFPVEIITC